MLRLSHLDETTFDAALGEASFRGVLERLPEAVLVLHRDQTILYANPAAGRLFGFAHRGELLGRALGLLIDPDEHDHARERLQDVLATGVPAPWLSVRLSRCVQAANVELRGTRVVCSGRPAVLVLVRSAAASGRGTISSPCPAASPPPLSLPRP